MAYNKLQALRDNCAAIEVVFNNGHKGFNGEDMDTLRKYSGFGGIKEVMFWQDYKTIKDVDRDVRNLGVDMAHMLSRLYYTVLEAVGRDEDKAYDIMSSISASVLNAFYTPAEVVDAVKGALKHTFGVFGIEAASFLEPSAGIGGFLPAAPEGCRTVAFEIDCLTAKILSALHPETEVYNKGFETINNVMEERVAFDVTASNIPFSRFGVHDAVFEKGDAVHKKSLEKIHRYFFVKALEQLEDGGVLAFVTSRGIADTAECDYLRQWLMEKGNLLAAVRLPDNLFMSGSGVEVGSDLIVVQRDTKKAWMTTSERQFTETKDKCLTVDGRSEMVHNVNTLLSQTRHAVFTHRRLDTNQYGKMVCLYYWRDGMDKLQYELENRLSRDMERNFIQSAWEYGHDEERKQREREKAEANAEALRRGREAHARKVEEMRPYYEEMMKTFNTLQSNERRDKREYPFERESLNDKYDEIVKKFGTLHQCESIIKNYSEYQLALSLERKEGKQWVKADVFDHPTAFHVVSGGEIATPMEALAMSLNEYGKVNMSYMEKLTGMSEEDVYAGLKNEIYLYPSKVTFGTPFPEWMHKSVVLNGNMYEKREELISYLASGGFSDFEREALKDTEAAIVAATPAHVEFDEIDIQMGARWLPDSYYGKFMQWLFQCQPAKIEYVPSADMYSVSWPSDYYACLGWTSGPYATDGYTGFKNFQFALEDKCPEIKMKKRIQNDDGTVTEVKVRDEAAIRRVQEKITLIRDKFDEWIHSPLMSDDDRRKIADIYNRMMNGSIRANFDGSMQTFPGLDFESLGIADLYQCQKDFIWMVKQLGFGIGWYEVGVGKTLMMICGSYEMHRLGLCHKPLIIGLKANIGQIAETYRKAYPNARILYPGKNDFTAVKRKQLFEQIANNDWDCVIMTHDQFKRIPQNSEVMKDIFRSELKDLEEATRLANESGDLNRDVMRGLEERKKSLINQLAKIEEKLQKQEQDVLDFQALGFDMIFVDEYHKWKNLGFTTHYKRVAGLGKTDGNDMTWQMLAAIRTIQKRTGKDGGAVFLSGTVVVNALTELYVAFKYLIPKKLAAMKMHCFDAWAANFAKKSIDYDLNLHAEIQQKERFRSYLNIPELSAMLRQITDFRTAEMVNIDRPKANVIEDFADPTEEQQILLDRLKQFATTGNWDCMEPVEKECPKNADTASGLIATNLARDISLDARLLGNNLFNDDPMNKVSRCAANVARYYKKFDAHKGTQFVFCDVSKMKDDGSWSLYADLLDKLVYKHGIPEKEIAIIHDYESEKSRLQLFDDLNAGRVRVVIGTTEKLGTGVNAQRRAVAVHHLDIPWRPADLEQRNGRAVRTGNEVKLWGNNTVDIIIYGTNRTLDAYKFKLLQNKAFFIKQINSGSIGSRHFDEDTMTEDSGIPYAELVAQLSGNQDLLVKAKLDGKIAQLESSKRNHKIAVIKAENKIKENNTDIEKLQKVIALQKKDLAYMEGYLSKHKEETGLNIIGSKDGSVEEVARQLRKYKTEVHVAPGLVVGHIYGLEIRMTSVLSASGNELESNCFQVVGPSGIKYSVQRYGSLGVSLEENYHAFDNLLTAIQTRIADNETGIRVREADNKVCKVTLDTPWSHEAEYERLLAEQKEVSARVQADLDAKEEAKQLAAAKAKAEAESK